MSSSLYRLGLLMASLRWKIVGAWVALLVIVVNFCVDLLYAKLDPRIAADR